MALQIIWTVDAKEQLNEILDYWHQRNGIKTYSQKLYQTVKNALRTLAIYPDAGRLTEHSAIRAKILKNTIYFIRLIKIIYLSQDIARDYILWRYAK